MSQQLDDLEAVRTIVTTLEKFEKIEQERIIRWAREKLGLNVVQVQQQAPFPVIQQSGNQQLQNPSKDLKSFVNQKNPTTDMQFAVTVAYYYKFEAPENERKDSINSETLQDAARLSSRTRLKNPGQTLINASFHGMLDKSEKGSYKINTVGENLVAMTLPQNNSSKSVKKTSKSVTKKTSQKSSKKKLSIK